MAGLWRPTARPARLRPDFVPISLAKRMLRQRSVFKLLIRTGPLIALAVVIALGIVAPASAQFFNFGGWTRPAPHSNGGWFGHFFRPFQPRPQQPRRVYHDYSRAPLPKKRDTVPEHTILVLGDGMADWL